MNEAFLDLFYQFILPLPAILIALTVHEVCHGYIAYKCGDPTAAVTGRLSFNPMRHIDPIGFISLMLIGFGAARPVQVNPRNFNHPRRDMALVALAGPISNLLLAFVGSLLWFLYLIYLYPAMAIGSAFLIGLADAIYYLLMYFCYINVGLCLFNLIPLPPLDGSHVVLACLPGKFYWKARRLEKACYYILLGLILASLVADRVPQLWFLDFFSLVLSPVQNFIVTNFMGLWETIFSGGIA
ncbi:MAG: site-2 protease family protein [Clostridia bacterium]|nr:site-2 protease family protein [Clostridia bacterium]